MALKPFKEFRKDISPSLDPFAGKDRQALLRDFYKLAQQKVEKEKLRLQIRKRVSKELRPRMHLYRRAQKAIQKALDSMEKAKSIFNKEPRPLVRPRWINLLEEARAGLQQARDSLRETEAFLATQIPQDMLKPTEESAEDFLLDRLGQVEESEEEVDKLWDSYESFWIDDYEPIHVRSRAVDYWFIWKLDGLLQDSFLPDGSKVPVGIRRKLIVRVFLAAFGERVEVTAVKTALDRIGKKPSRYLTQT